MGIVLFFLQQIVNNLTNGGRKMIFELTSEDLMMREMLRTFTKNEVEPIAAEFDE